MSHVEDASTLSVTWWKSRQSAAQSDCVECGIVDAEKVAIRDSKRPNGPALLFPRGALSAFAAAAASGEFGSVE